MRVKINMKKLSFEFQKKKKISCIFEMMHRSGKKSFVPI